MKIKWRDLCSMHAKHPHLIFILPLTQCPVSQAFMQMPPLYLKSACFSQKCYCPFHTHAHTHTYICSCFVASWSDGGLSH